SPNPVILYHELSHALRTATNSTLPTSRSCTGSQEEQAAERDENDMREQLGVPRIDANNHCGAVCSGGSNQNCCIVASVAIGSQSIEVDALRRIRDGLLRTSTIGFSFFEHLHHDYYAFSPELVRMMGGNQELVDQVATYVVRPLVLSLHLIYDRLVLG